MAMYLHNEKIVVDIPNSEAVVDCQIKGIKDRDVTGYYTNDDRSLKKGIETFFGNFDMAFEIDVWHTQLYVNNINEKVMPLKKSFKSGLANFNSNANVFNENKLIPAMFFGGTDGRYLKFDNNNLICKAFKNILLGDITSLIIEKNEGKFILYPVLRKDFLKILARKSEMHTKQELADILDYYYESTSSKKTGIHLFGINYCFELNQYKTKDIEEIISLTKNISTFLSYYVEIINGVKIGLELFDLEENLNELEKIKYDYITQKNNGENLIVYGTPGCGKSYYVQNTLIKEKGINEENVVRTTFFQDYTNTDFVGQILPKVHVDKSVTYEFNPGPFTIALKKAILNPKDNVVLVIEEINRGNAASIFGDIFQLLDRKNGISEYSLVNINIQDYLNKEFANKGLEFDYIKIPGNMHIYATMNTSDQNVFTLDTAFKRRWKFKKMINEFKDDHAYANELVPGMLKTTWKGFVDSINRFIKENNNSLMNEDKQIGVYFVSEENFHIETFDGNKNDQVEAIAYKMLEYLWDDVVKYDRDSMFKNPQTLDDLVRDYKEKGEEVFVDGIIEEQ